MSKLTVLARTKESCFMQQTSRDLNKGLSLKRNKERNEREEELVDGIKGIQDFLPQPPKKIEHDRTQL